LTADVYVGAASGEDFTPAPVDERKLKQDAGSERLVLELVRTADILAEVAAHVPRPRLVIGFAAETHDLEAYARDKLARKRVDLIAANRVGEAGSGFESQDNTLVVYGPGLERTLGPAPKTRLADALLDLAAARLETMR
jgi:phosphopantothenoylcysteine decarboxylase/phosphopantothenate--cysteine ligase